ncbi:conserved Plasmodium protein, unknown function [Plasmodium relictum]|uniref:RAP domain-containing protein n=1 Tax=Plasmodium relictum TaxID=85471 RepID=A0A1J1H9J3_PLARL|nr:conserved Plasmodium protein, unknown function [Plasmodium relictum]CRH01613.1 conserved Plasmodium protein, unknown function [Plasmodium relictum]
MKKSKLIILKNNDPLKKKRNFCFFLSLRKYNPKIINKENDDNSIKREYDIFKYFDGNKNIIKTTSYILKEHLNDFIFIKQQGNFYNYFYNSYPFIINRYVNYIKENYVIEKNENNEKKKRNNKVENNNIENTNYLFLFHYYNKNTKDGMERKEFLNFVNKSINFHNNTTKFLKCLKENIYMNRKINKNEDIKLNLVFENIIDKINETNDINKKIEILLYLANICNENSSPIIYSNIKKYIQEIYDSLIKKTKKGVVEHYLIFLLYKEFLSSKNEKYINMDIKNYLSEEISFYNYLKNENINIFLLSLIYRDLSFLNNYELKYVLMNLVLSKIKNCDFLTNLDTHNNNVLFRNKNNNLNNSLLTFFSSSLLRNNFFSFLKDYDYIDYSGVINYSKDLNINDLNNYICHNLLTALIQFKHSQSKYYDMIKLYKKKYFLDNEKNAILFNYIFKLKENTDYMNEFIMNNIMFFTKYFIKNKSSFSNNLYFNILKVYCDFLSTIKDSENYDLKKKNSLINDSKKIINYCINEIYYNINSYTLKEFSSFIYLIKKLPANFSFELKSEANYSNKIKNIFYKDKKKESLLISNILHFNIDGINKTTIKDTNEKNILHEHIKLSNNNSNEVYNNTVNNSEDKLNKSMLERKGEDIEIIEKISSNISKENNKQKKEESESSKHDSYLYTLGKDNLKTKKNVTIINKKDFVILVSLSIFDEMNEDFVLKIKEKELHLMKEKDKYNIYEYIYENHYNHFLNNSSSYIEHINEKFDEITKEKIINYFVLFTHISKLDIYELCLLINTMNEINKFQKFVDFFISKHIENILYQEFKDDHINNKEIKFNYEFSENYLDNYISKINEKKEKLENFQNAIENKNSNTNAKTQKHFDEINLSIHTPYSSNFEKYYYEYDILTSTINLFLTLDENSITKHTIAKYLKDIDYNKVNILKVDFDNFFLKNNHKQKVRKDDKTYLFNENLEERMKSENFNDSFYLDYKLLFINSDSSNITRNGVNDKNNSTYIEEEKILGTTLNNVIIYNILENRLKYDTNLKNHFLHKQNYEKEQIKHFYEKEMLTLNNILSLMNYVNQINNDMKYMNLLTLILKNIILCKDEIVEIKTYRELTTFLLNIKNFYQKMYIQSQYSYLNMLLMYYVKSIQTFIPFFYFSDYLKIMQVYIKYDIAGNYLKYLVILNNEFNKMNIKNINFYYVHIILYLYLKLNYINEKFLSNLLHYYINSLYQRINSLDITIIENLIKTNELLISLCIKNKDIINFNYMLIQKFGNFSNEFKLDDLDKSEDKDINSLNKNNSNVKFSANTIFNKQFISNSDSCNTEFNENIVENLSNNEYNTNLLIKKNNDNTIKNNIGILHNQTNCEKIDDENFIKYKKNYNDKHNISNYVNKNISKNIENSIVAQNFKLSFIQKLNIIYFLFKFSFYNDLIKLYYLQLINECMNNKNTNISDEDYCRLYEIYVHVILNFYFISFNKNNKYINFILSNLPCYYWYKREEEKLNLFVSSKHYNDINNILKLLNLNFLTPTLTEIYFIHFFNDINKTNYSLQIPQKFLCIYQKYNLVIDDIKNKNIAILCIPEEHELRYSNNDKKVLVNESNYIFENIKKTYATSLLFLSEWKNMNIEEKCDYIMRILHSAVNN